MGKFQRGKEICHRCNNPGCVNPNHLYAGTHSENMKDSKLARRYDRKLRKIDKEKLRGISNRMLVNWDERKSE